MTCVGWLDTCRPRTKSCAPLVRSGSSQLEHLDLEPQTAERAKMMRRSLRKSHVLSREGARTIAVSGHIQREAQHRHVASQSHDCTAGRGAPLEQFSRLLRWVAPSPRRSSAAEARAPDPPFGGLSSPEGSHSGQQRKAAPATAPAGHPNHAHVPWLHAPTSPGAVQRAQARPACSHKVLTHDCRTLRSRRSSEWMQLETDFETFFPTAEGSGGIHMEIRGQLVATSLP